MRKIWLLIIFLLNIAILLSTENNYKSVEDAIKTAIEEDIWFCGKDSAFYDFAGTKYSVKLYKNNEEKQTEEIGVFRKKIYYGVGIWKEKPEAFSIIISSIIYENELKELEKRLKEMKYHTYKTVDIKIEKIKKPIYSKNQDYFNIITKEVVKQLKNGGSGINLEKVRKIYLKKYHENDKETYLIIEKEDNKYLLININIHENHEIVFGKRMKIEEDGEYYMIQQYKKVSIEIKY